MKHMCKIDDEQVSTSQVTHRLHMRQSNGQWPCGFKFRFSEWVRDVRCAVSLGRVVSFSSKWADCLFACCIQIGRDPWRNGPLESGGLYCAATHGEQAADANKWRQMWRSLGPAPVDPGSGAFDWPLGSLVVELACCAAVFQVLSSARSTQ